jgi:osmotically-inducible protein OsmY
MEIVPAGASTMRTDIQLQAEILDELRHDRHVRASDVGVQVAGGVVTLTGRVCSYAKKVAAAEAAHRVPGVLDVANEIEVRPAGPAAPTDAEIARAVRLALVADWLVPDHAIRTTVCRGWVTLEGAVPHSQDLVAAERAARAVPDVVELVNHLAVEHEPVAIPVGAA